jgi:uncharacterized protein
LTSEDRPLIVWRIFDGKTGHDIQSQGLSDALSRLRHCRVFHLRAPPLKTTLAGLVKREFKAADRLPDPDLIIGAGHGTHMSILCAKVARGGTSVVLMKPSLPAPCFDLCLIPEHDNPTRRQNTVITTGALTTILPSLKKDQSRGLFLIGGPSRHFSWDQPGLIKQIKKIVLQSSIQWQLTDSPRTPVPTRTAFAEMDLDNLTYTTFSKSSREWLERQIALSSTIWATADSITMISEALTSGAAVGLLSMPEKRQGRITTATKRLSSSGLVTTYAAWEKGRPLSPPGREINESTRCAEILLERIHQSNR